jgi:hypothetical protein
MNINEFLFEFEMNKETEGPGTYFPLSNGHEREAPSPSSAPE